MAVLYRKYRPQNFADVLDQKYIIRTLKNQVSTGQTAHAYLFTGSRGVGKTSIARILAKAVNCQKPKDGEPCDNCEPCRQISKNLFLDLVEIDAASNTGVENIRDLIEHVKFSPSAGKFKVFIIDEVHMLSKSAFNALLKTLEEPPKHAIFILATTEINKVPATIISRTQRFDFKRLGSEYLKLHLKKILKAEKIKLHEEVIEIIAENADGSVRDSLTLLEKVTTLGEDATVEECRQLLGITDIALCRRLLELILQGEAENIPAFYNGLLEQGVDFAVFNRDFLEFVRKVLIYSVSGGQVEDGKNAPDDSVKNFAGQGSSPDFIFIIRLFLKSYKDLSSAPRAEIPLLLASLEAAYRKVVNAGPAFKATAPVIPASAPQNSWSSKTVNPEITSRLQVKPSVLEESGVESVLVESEVREWWPKVIADIKKQNSPLANLIRTGVLEEVSGSSIIIGVKFPFHKQNIESQKNQTLIREAIERVSGKRAAVRAAVTKTDTEGEKISSAAALGDALKIFGGELVE